MEEAEFRDKVFPYHPMMMRLALRMLRDRDSALDCVQECLTTLWNKRHLLNDISNIRTYCMTCVHHQCLSTLKNIATTNCRQSEDSSEYCKDFSDSSPTAQHRLELQEKVEIVKEALSTLNDNERAVMLGVISGASGDEIAHATGLSNGNIRTITCRCRKYLKEYLHKRFDD